MRHSVLVVDDEETIRNAWQKALRYAGYHAFVASTAADALKVCDEHSIDLVLLDFIMPSTDGVKLLVEIRKRLPYIRSIIVSGKLDPDISAREISEELKASIESDLYLHKPLSNPELCDAVRTVLDAERSTDWKDLAQQESKTRHSTKKAASAASQGLKTRRRKR